MGRRYSELLVILFLFAQQAEGADRLPKRVNAQNGFRPQSQTPRIEKYKYATKDGKEGSGSLSTMNESSAGALKKIQTTNQNKLSRFFDDMDKQIFVTTLPLSAIFAIMPLASASDLFWVNRLGDTLAVAGQQAANQVYQSAFWLFSFLPSVTATLVSQTHANGDLEGTQDAICQALFFAMFISTFGATFMFNWPAKALKSILKAGSPALDVATPYLRIRAFSFFPMLFAFVGFSAFRGTMDVKTSVKITLISSFVTMFSEPILIHVLGIGVCGAAIASLCGELTSAFINLKLLKERNFITWEKIWRIPPTKSLAPLIKGGLSLQIRSFCLNFIFLMVARVTQSLDDTGVSAAAHALAAQTFQLGGIILGALGMASQTMIPKAMISSTEMNGGRPVSSISNAQPLIKRLFMWGSTIGFMVGFVQLLLLPAILRSSPLPEVRQAARNPALIAIAFQGVNGLVSVGEGIMMGIGSFSMLSVNIILATMGYFGALRIFPGTLGLTGVWISMAIFTMIRLAGVLVHLFVKKPVSEKI